MSLDIGLVMQGVALAGQAVKFVIDAVQRDRDRACWHPAGGCVQAAEPCPGPGCPLPRPWTAGTCGRTVARRMERAEGGTRRTDGAARPAASEARWACRGRIRRHGRHRRC